MKQLDMTSAEIKATLSHIIQTNIALQAQGKTPIAASISGPAGLGKTSVIEQVATENNIKHFVTLNMSQIDEIGDITGFPIKEYLMKKDGKGIYIDEKVVDSYVAKGYELTNNSRMSFAKPAWLAGKNESLILNLDDWSRAQPRFLQAIMQIIQKQEFISWKLPKGSHIIMSENPADGTYDVTDVDDAFRSRFLTFNMKFEVEVWAEWAVQNNIDQRAINFLLLHPEIVDNKNPRVNPRSLVLFFDTISTIKDFEKDLALIQIIGESAIGPEVTTLFTSFINNKLDRIISPKEIFDTTKEFNKVKAEIVDLVGAGTKYRGDLAYVITTRLINYLNFEMQPNDITKEMVKRTEELVLSECLGSDLRYVIVKKVIPNNSKFNSLYTNNDVIDMVLE